MKDFKEIKKWLADADAVIVTAGNGFAQMEGLDMFDNLTFPIEYKNIREKYHVKTIADALDKDFDSWDEKWQFWSQLINEYSVEYEPSKAMKQLKELLDGKNYFIATSTFGHFFEKAGFDQEKIFNVFGDWTMMQCSSGLNHGTRSDLSTVKRYVNGQGEVPKCEDCNSPMELHMPLNTHFFPDEDANTRFRWFLTRNQTNKVVVLELGVDPTSPQLLDPMAKLIEQFKDWHYVAADLSQDELPDDIQKRSVGLEMALPEAIEKISK